MRNALRVTAAAMLLVSACAPKVIPVPVVSTPKFPDFIVPTIPPAYAGSPAAAAEDRGWRFLQAGDLRSAERELVATLKAIPEFYPAETGLGYVELARKDALAALQHFDRAVQQQPSYPAALVGRGRALLALNRDADAAAAFEAATVADPSLSDLRRQVEVLKFRGLEQTIGAAREAARAGRLDEAVNVYARAIASSPDSPFLYRELAVVDRQKGEVDAALENFRKAVALDPSDARSLEQIGDLLDSRNDYEGAAKAFNEANAIEPTGALARKIDTIREKVELARLPAEYRAIDDASEITRADLAALIGVRLGALLRVRRRDAVPITDLRTTWASPWIVAVAGAGVMEPYANHAFQPRSLVRRTDLAQAAARLLSRIAAGDPAQANSWQSARRTFSDLSPGHLAYAAASAAVAAGVMTVGPDNAFLPSRPVTGAEALSAIGRLETLARLPSTRGSGPR
jgi:tetratricopeptide (TPR) repeat protein